MQAEDIAAFQEQIDEIDRKIDLLTQAQRLMWQIDTQLNKHFYQPVSIIEDNIGIMRARLEREKRDYELFLK